MNHLRRGAAALAVAALLAGPAGAGEAQDRLFALGALDSVETGSRILFTHEREGAAAAAAALPPLENGSVEVLLTPSASTDGRDAEVTLRDGARVRELNPFPAAAGNPMLMVFMETSVRSMAAATGGSPFYIRNRMRDALRSQDEGRPVTVEVEGRPVDAVRYSFKPFAGDPNAARMGPFAALEIAFVTSEAAPGGILALETVAGPDASGAPAFREAMTFQRLETGG